jgi:hypothetical protein
MLRKASQLIPGSGRLRARHAAILAGSILAVVAAPFAVAAGTGNPIKGGARNPSANPSISYTSETQIIADNSSYGTRQSNKGTGGGAIYGCRSATGGPGCIVADNLNTGSAFVFSSAGNVGGTINLKNVNGAPLTTNAKGVATGFNANYLQGRQASEFVLSKEAATNYVQTSQLLFADINQKGELGAHSGATASSLVQGSTTAYTVTFNTNVSKCSLTASPVGQALTTGSIGLLTSTANPDLVEVSAPSALTAGFNVQVIC